MAGPLAGVGSQQVPLSQPFQPGGSDSARAARQEVEREPQNNEIQKTRSSQAAQPRETDADKGHQSRSNDSLAKSLSSASNSNDPSSAPPRGSVVNLTV